MQSEPLLWYVLSSRYPAVTSNLCLYCWPAHTLSTGGICSENPGNMFSFGSFVCREPAWAGTFYLVVLAPISRTTGYGMHRSIFPNVLSSAPPLEYYLLVWYLFIIKERQHPHTWGGRLVHWASTYLYLTLPLEVNLVLLIVQSTGGPYCYIPEVEIKGGLCLNSSYFCRVPHSTFHLISSLLYIVGRPVDHSFYKLLYLPLHVCWINNNTQSFGMLLNFSSIVVSRLTENRNVSSYQNGIFP